MQTLPGGLKAVVVVWIASCTLPACTPLEGLTTSFGPCEGEVTYPWVITGLSGERATQDVNGLGVTAVVALGATVRLRVEPGWRGCDATLGSVSWSSSNPTVATLSPVGQGEASLTAVGLGETVVSARLVFADSPSQVVMPQVSAKGGSIRDVSHVRVVQP